MRAYFNSDNYAPVLPEVMDALKLTPQKVTELKAELPAHLKTVESMLS